ncbi:NAD(P)H:quinone oxidoreductase, type IV [Mycobacterium sp. TKK-01-0059]|uniref:NAD(P)H:quinone oxidoreductase n=1 Tax=Mycobacterium sp. TKK-01-0059 TaxID=1324269 RepID=UPI0004D6699C|nr:NAD(P)H:quinone oxidoreductase [Mycobacterium sp. TKK-01-0059]KEF94983.1 NAD(P)H:quinone oxidoreductase, type IV [Mycobacterium sp. TKK-01-0059]
MSTVANVTIVYYSSTGTIYQLADSVRAGAAEVGAEVRLRRVHELASAEAIATNSAWAAHLAETEHIPTATHDDLLWADAIVFGTPTRFGNVAAQLKQFMDTLSSLWHRDLLSDKVYSGFTSSASMHGGQESTLLALYNSIYHFGGILVTPGYKNHTDDSNHNPYGASYVTGDDPGSIDDAAREAAQFQGRRVATMAAALTNGLADPDTPVA